MKKYNLIVYGWGVTASAHSLTQEQVDVVNEEKFAMSVEDLADIAVNFEDLIENYSPFETNMWSIDKPLLNGKTQFEVRDEDGNVVLDFDIEDVINKFIEDEDYPVNIYNSYPMEGEQENILLWIDENKGVICNFTFETEDEIKVEDFKYLPSMIETPDGDWDIIETMMYKDSELQIEYEVTDVDNKALTVELYELKNLN
jgi:hypothetical protein